MEACLPGCRRLGQFDALAARAHRLDAQAARTNLLRRQWASSSDAQHYRAVAVRRTVFGWLSSATTCVDRSTHRAPHHPPASGSTTSSHRSEPLPRTLSWKMIVQISSTTTNAEPPSLDRFTSAPPGAQQEGNVIVHRQSAHGAKETHRVRARTEVLGSAATPPHRADCWQQDATHKGARWGGRAAELHCSRALCLAAASGSVPPCAACA